MIHRAVAPECPSRVVVLGGSGCVGGAVVRQLQAQEVEVISASSREIDLCMPEAVAALQRLMRDGDALVIASALTPDRGKDVGTLMRNLAMGQQLSAFLSQAELSQIIYISSDAVYEERASLIREATPTAPASFHGLMHLVREQMVTQAAGASKIPLMIVRPTLLYGAEDTHHGYGPNRFLRTALQSGTITLFGEGEEQRDHLFIRDLARLVSLGLMLKSEGILNVATGRSVSFAEVARLIVESSGEEIRIERRPRSTPITHRHFETAEMARAFPTFRTTSLRCGLTEALDALRAGVLEARRA